jgi:hypothetical protein
MKISDYSALTGAAAATGDLLYIVDVSATTAGSKKITLQELFSLADNTALKIGSGNDIVLLWDGTDLLVSQATADSIIKWGVSGAGINHVFYGDTATRDMTWDQTNDQLLFNDNAKLTLGTGSDISFLWDATNLVVSQAATDSFIQWGISGAGINHTFFGDTATRDMTWDQTNDQLLFADNAKLAIGTGAGAAGDITFSWNATKLLVAQLTTNSAIDWGVDDDGIDQNWYGATASALMQWDQSADTLIFTGAAGVQGLRVKQAGAVAITTTRVMTLADSGGIFTVSQAAAYDIDLPSPTTGPGTWFVFSLTAPGANNVTITVTGSAATFVGTIVNDVTSVLPATGSTLTFASGASALGDTIIIRAIATNLYHVQAVSSAAGGITIA